MDVSDLQEAADISLVVGGVFGKMNGIILVRLLSVYCCICFVFWK